MPSREIKDNEKFARANEQVMIDFERFRLQLAKEGFFDPSYAHVVYRLLELLVIHAIGIYLVLAGWRWIGTAIIAIGNGRSGWFMHEGGHRRLLPLSLLLGLVFRLPFF